MSQILTIVEKDSTVLLILWVILFVLTVFTGIKASPDKALLKRSDVSLPLTALSWNPTSGPELFLNWDSKDTKNELRRALKWDFACLVVYPLSTSLACLLLTPFMISKLGVPFSLTKVIIALQFLGGFIDIIENVGLLRVLDGRADEPWLSLLPWCAVLKIVFPVIGTLYVLVGLGMWVYVRFLSR